MVSLCRCFVGLCRGNYELASVCCGFCNRWQQKWFLCANSSWDYSGEKKMLDIVVACGFRNRWQRKWFLFASSSWDYAGEKKMLEIVVASVKGDSKNGSSLSVLRGTMPGKTIKWLRVIVVPLCQFFVGLCWQKNVRDCRGFCKRWQLKWFLSVGSSWDYAGGIMNWLGCVVDSGTGGSENGSSLPVLRGIMLVKKKC